jgi:hypothetical protein
MEQSVLERKKIGITHGELLTSAIVILSAILMFWKTTDVRLSALEIRMNETEKSKDLFMRKLDKLQETVNEVNLSLKDKQDRKN